MKIKEVGGKIIYKCEVCGKEHDRVEKALDCAWEDDNILTTIKAMKVKYENDNILNDMIKMYTVSKINFDTGKDIVYCYSLEKFIEDILKEGFTNNDGFSITHEFSSNVDLKPYLCYYNNKLSELSGNNNYKIMCYECEVCTEHHGGKHYHVELVDIMNVEYYNILKKEGKIC